MQIALYTYHKHSASAKALAQELQIFRLPYRAKPRFRKTDTIINWGNSHFPAWGDEALSRIHRWINHPTNVKIACNKLSTFRELSFQGVPIPKFTTFPEIVRGSLSGRDKLEWFGRRCLSGSGGEGIVPIKGTATIIPSFPLYVKYVDKKFEYRVHVFNGQGICIQQKKVKNGIEKGDGAIRNLKNGWIFARKGIKGPIELVSNIAIRAIRALGLHFGAVDIIFDARFNKVYVLEINTAPGLQGSTIGNYAEAIRDYTATGV